MNSLNNKDPLGLIEFMSHYPIQVIPVSLYCRVFNDTESAIKKRLQRKTWALGKEIKKPKGQNQLWVDLDEVQNWVRDL